MALVEAVTAGLVSGAAGAVAGNAVRSGSLSELRMGPEPAEPGPQRFDRERYSTDYDDFIEGEFVDPNAPSRGNFEPYVPPENTAPPSGSNSGDAPDPVAPPAQPEGEPSFGELLAQLMEPGQSVAIPYPVDGPSSAPATPWRALGILGALGVGGYFLWRRYA